MDTEKNLRRMPIEYLWDGLILEDDIFNYNGSVLLIPRGEIVTTSKLKKLSIRSGKRLQKTRVVTRN